MYKPELLVIAGCNGSGKSSFSKYLASSKFTPFDYDLKYLEFYKSLFDSDIKEKMAHNLAFEELEKQIYHSIETQSNFCYETNFNSTPLYWPKKFKESGFKLSLIFLALDSIAEAKRRVSIRVQNGGHFVPEAEIEQRYYDGFSNLNLHHTYFDCVDIFDSSFKEQEPACIISIEQQHFYEHREIPKFLLPLVPDLLSAK